ncbi:MAG: hypothetical protein ACLQUY_09875 [Ktedonobacterales bacterium]
MASEIKDDHPQVLPITRGQAPVVNRTGVWLDTLGGFWTKINNDWIFNLAGLLAYNFLMASFPLLLLLLAGCGVVLQLLSPHAELQLQQTLAAALPGTTGSILVRGVSAHLKKSAGLLLAVGLVAALLFCGATYTFVPNRRRHYRTWRHKPGHCRAAQRLQWTSG